MPPATVDDPQARATLATIDAFNAAFNRHDVDGVMALMTEDCLFDSTRPPPDGEQLIGQVRVREFWQGFFGRSPQARFESEEQFACGDRAVVLWRYHWVRDGQPGHVRGVDIFRVRDGRVAEKRSYVKG
jgi:ketosteroid isomerase-like protein